jgi:serine phosphatase RsbU (regulator of sigma subunit)
MTHEVSFASSEISLLFFTNEQHIKIKGNKFSSLKDFSAKNFQNHNLTLTKGSFVVMCTDGVKDQFGGQENKKLKSSGKIQMVKRALMSDKFEKSQALARFIDEWKGSNDQTDDITIFGWGFLKNLRVFEVRILIDNP